MPARHTILDRVEIPISCDADWTEMPGTDRVRHCAICDQNVYNLSAMTQREAEDLVERSGGKLCAKIYRRPDGGILTRNCPPGIRALSLKLVRRASWMMSAVLGWSPLAAQEAPKIPEHGGALVQIERSENEGASVTGTIYDPAGAVVRGTNLTFAPVAGGKKVEVRSSEDGRYRVPSLAPGEYAVTIQSPGFKLINKKLTLQSNQAMRVDATLEIGDILMGVMVIAAASPEPVSPAKPVKKAKKN